MNQASNKFKIMFKIQVYLFVLAVLSQQVSAGKLLSYRVTGESAFDEAECKDIDIPLCNRLPYNRTSKNNLYGEIETEQVLEELAKYDRLFKFKCSVFLELLVCSYYLPICASKPLLPCKELCHIVQNDCEPQLNANNFHWPDELDCDKFVTHQETKLCFMTKEVQLHLSDSKSSGATNQPSNSLLPVSNQRPDSAKSTPDHLSIKQNFTCPIELRKPMNSRHSFRIGNAESKYCAYPCDAFYSDKSTVDQARTLNLIYSSVSLTINLTLILTYLMDRSRFRYPLKAIVYMSICYLAISVLHIVGYLLEETIACDLDESNRILNDTTTKSLAIGDKFTCKLSFVLVNFWTICSLLWFVMLSITFHLEMVFMWATEVFEKQNFLFNIVVLIFGSLHTLYAACKFELQGDPITGLCAINLDQQFANLILPEIVLLIVGLLMFAITIGHFFKVKQLLRRKHIGIKEFESFVFKLLLFLLVYLIAYAAQFVIFYFEFYNFDLWTKQWYKATCDRNPKITCPSWISSWKPNQQFRPTLTFAAFKYLSNYLPCLAVCSVLFCNKTFQIWSKFFNKMFRKLFNRK